MKTILLGGLDPMLRDQARRAFARHPSEFELRAPASPKELREFLTRSEGDLLVIDLEIQGGAGLEWLAAVSETQAPLSILAIGQGPTPDVRRYEAKFPGRFFPLVKYLQKPVGADVLVEEAMDELRQATWGVIQGLSLPSLLQMLNMEQKTCTIRVTSGRRSGFFYLRDGQVINARYRRLEGMDAVQLLIGVVSPKMEIDSHLHDSTQRVDLRLEEILMSAAQFQDERALDGSMPFHAEDSDAIPISEIGKWGRAPAAPPSKASPKPSRGGWITLALVLAPLLAGGGWLLFPRTVEVDIQSSPPAAAISLDGKALGVTPLRLKLPNPPQGSLTLLLPGYQPYQHQLESRDRSLNCTLQAVPLPPEPAVNIESPAPSPTPAVTPKAKSKKRPEAQAPSKSDIFDQLRKQKD